MYFYEMGVLVLGYCFGNMTNDVDNISRTMASRSLHDVYRDEVLEDGKLRKAMRPLTNSSVFAPDFRRYDIVFAAAARAAGRHLRLLAGTVAFP